MKRFGPLSAKGYGRLVALLASFLALGMAGCSTVNVADQRLVAKENMTFQDSDVFDYSLVSHVLVEPGTAGSGGGQASGCTSCK